MAAADTMTASAMDVGASDFSDERPVSGAAGQPNVSSTERIASGLAGAALATFAIAGRKKSPVGMALAAAGTYLVYRGVTGHCAAYAALRTGTAHSTDSDNAVIPHGQGIKIEQSITIDKPASELYTFWRSFENLPRFMAHLESVTVLDDKRSHWVARAPFGKTVEWDAEIINEVENELIAWRSVENADIANAGSVRFTPVPGGRGTEVRVVLEYNPPAGKLGAAVAKLFGEEPDYQVRDDLRHFKSLMEAGEIPTNEGQPHG